MAWVDSNGTKLYAEETAEGPPVLFVHEFSGDLRSWDPQVRYFSRRYRCLTFNARGYPPSDAPDDAEAYSQDAAVDDIGAVLDHFEVDRAHIVGHSMGAYSTLLFGLQHPERARSLVVAGCGYGSDPDGDPEREATWERELDDLAAHYRDNIDAAAAAHASAPGRIAHQLKDPRGWDEFATRLAGHSPHGSAHTLRRVQKLRPSVYGLEDELRELAVPTLVVAGDEDEPCLEPGVFMKRTIPASGLAIFPKAGHTINLEEPGQFNATLESFFATVEAGRWQPRDPRSRPTHQMGRVDDDR